MTDTPNFSFHFSENKLAAFIKSKVFFDIKHNRNTFFIRIDNEMRIEDMEE